MKAGEVESRLASLGHELPEVPEPGGSYVPAVRAGALIFTSGQLPRKGGELAHAGKVGAEVTIAQAQQAARLCVLNALAAVRASAGSLDAVARVVKLTGFVASAEGFVAQPKVMDAASELLVGAFGDRGRHARSAVGVAELPRGAPVEVVVALADA